MTDLDQKLFVFENVFQFINSFILKPNSLKWSKIRNGFY